MIINGGRTLDLLFKTICDHEATCHVQSLTSTEWFLVFTCVAILVAQLPNLNSMVGVSLIGAITAIGYCTLILVLSITKGRPIDISYGQFDVAKSSMEKISDILNAFGIIALAFRGHNLILEIQVSIYNILILLKVQKHILAHNFTTCQVANCNWHLLTNVLVYSLRRFRTVSTYIEK